MLRALLGIDERPLYAFSQASGIALILRSFRQENLAPLISSFILLTCSLCGSIVAPLPFMF